MVAPEHAPAAELLRSLCDPRTDRAADLALPVGAILHDAIEHKMICLLADHLDRTCLAPRLSRAVRRFLTSTLRTNQHKTLVHRHEAERIMAALARDHVPAVLLGGLAVESRLYHGRGGRQFSDIDILTAPTQRARAREILSRLGYTAPPDAGRAGLVQLRDDLLVPRITVDLTGALAHTSDAKAVTAALRRAEPAPLPVLAPGDELLHLLARAATRASWSIYSDALRSYLLNPPGSALRQDLPMPAPARAGWARLRRHWPELPPTLTEVPA